MDIEVCTSTTFGIHVCSAALRGDLDIEFTHTVTKKNTKLLAAILCARKNSVVTTSPVPPKPRILDSHLCGISILNFMIIRQML
jgi:hypothetical protein